MEMNDIKLESKKKGSKTLVKCLVCGEIFDSSLEKCPVCGVGREHFVPYEEESIAFKNDTEDVFVILGNGAAGISAAAAIRERNKTCSIHLISNEAVLSYNRPMLTKSLITLTDAGQIAVHERTWYDQNNIINHLNVNIYQIKPEEKEIYLSDGSKVKYDKCIYALGAECFIPPIAGIEKPEVIAIRKITDAKKIVELIPKVKNAVVIGGGVLGLEAAWEISKAGCKVTVLEMADQLMGRQLDKEAGEFLLNIVKETGIELRLNAVVTEITGESSVSGVKLSKGEFYPAQMVIVSSGIVPNITLAKASGIEAARGIIVNEFMETNVPNIYACGDCAEYQGVNFGIWPQALEMGKVAGANAAGDAFVYEKINPMLTFTGMNTLLF
ncbi:MAG: pyridine nucleotide-disulfide oxidoreductase, partial [Anaerocolumna sp.]|nr:pyridine nucleotide-disulfide oxidoreductase [Anaerocolumna sp.]